MNFFKNLDSEIKNIVERNEELSKIGEYLGMFSDELTKYFGTTVGFSGLNELLILRTLYHVIECEYGTGFRPEKYTRDISVFYHKEANIVLGSNVQLRVSIDSEKERLRPDIVIYKPKKDKINEIDKLIAAIEVKAYPVKGEDTIKNMANRLKKIQKYYKGANVVLILYSTYGVKEAKVKEICNSKGVGLIIIENNESPVRDVFKKLIMLNNLK